MMKNLYIFLFLSVMLLISGFVTAQPQIKAKSMPVSINIHKKKVPPVLEISNIRFSDENRNNCIDGLEKCAISFQISNSGKGPADGMKMSVKNQESMPGLLFQASSALNPLLPGSKIDVSISLEGTMKLVNGIAKLQIEFEEKLGFPPDPIDLNIETREFQKPEIKVVDYQILTENGTVTLGEPVAINILVQNVGQGIAEQVGASFELPLQNIIPNTEEKITIGTLKPGESKHINFEFYPNKLYSGKTIPVTISLNEKWGRYTQNKMVEAIVGAKTSGTSVNIAGNQPVSFLPITEASLTADVDKNIPYSGAKNPHAFALIIGNEDYTKYQPGLSSESNVHFAVNDARTFAKYAENTLGIDTNNIFLHENAISSKMNSEIERLSKLIELKKGQADVYVYYAGHGFPDEANNQSYLMPVDISGANVSAGISLANLYSKLTQSPSKRVTIFIDACFSGAGREAGLLAARSVRIKPKEEQVAGNLVVFSASSGDQLALPYSEKQHGLFTYFLLKSLQETKGNITYNELFEKLKNNVSLNAVRDLGKEQSPTVIFSPQVADQWGKWSFLKY